MAGQNLNFRIKGSLKLIEYALQDHFSQRELNWRSLSCPFKSEFQ